MTIRFLKDAKNLQELKSLYFRLAKQYHPDVTGGDLETMKLINSEYDYLKTVLKNAEDTRQAEQESTDSMENFKDVIDQLIKYENITISIVGTWLWVEGDTKPIKEELKTLKFFWNSKRMLWQRKPDEEQNHKFKNSKESDAEIKNRYGCKTIIASNSNRSFALV